MDSNSVEDYQRSQLLQKVQFKQYMPKIKSTIPTKPVVPISCFRTYGAFIVYFFVVILLLDIDLNLRDSNQVKNQVLNNISQNIANQKNAITGNVQSSNLQISLQNPVQANKIQKQKDQLQKDKVSAQNLPANDVNAQKHSQVKTPTQLQRSMVVPKVQTSAPKQAKKPVKHQISIGANTQNPNQIQKLILKAENAQKITSAPTTIKVADDMKVTAVFVSTNNLISLNNSLTSFYKFNTYPLQNVIVIYSRQYSDQLSNLLIRFPQVRWVLFQSKLSKLAAIDQAYKLVSTPYVFFSDDSEYYIKEGFIQASIGQFRKNPNLLQFQLRKPNLKVDGISKVGDSTSLKLSFSAGLRKISDYQKINRSYTKFSNWRQEEKYIQKLTQYYKKSNGVIGVSETQYVKLIQAP